MTFSYTNRPTINNVDEIRFLVQDVNGETFLIHDEEIAYLITKYEGNVNAVCAAVCEVMATVHAKKQEISVSNYRQNNDSVYRKLLDRADRFRKNAVTTDHFKCAAISKTQKEAQQNNDDNTEPCFRAGLMDNPQAPADPYEESNTLT